MTSASAMQLSTFSFSWYWTLSWSSSALNSSSSDISGGPTTKASMSNWENA